MKIDGYTVQEIADTLKISYTTAHKRLERLGIEPITTGAIYPKEALEAIRNVPGKGRPRKEPAPTAKAKKPAKK
jgi:predicted ArsR family transcriptional regulator